MYLILLIVQQYTIINTTLNMTHDNEHNTQYDSR